jgi:hypothetical protein
MGVPGDMNLELLDYIDDVDGMHWSEDPLSMGERWSRLMFSPFSRERE